MEFIKQEDRKRILEQLPIIKLAVKEWIFVDIHLSQKSDKDFTIEDIVKLIQLPFTSYEGMLCIAGPLSLLMMLHKKTGQSTSDISKNITNTLPKDSCEIHICEATAEKMAAIEVMIKLHHQDHKKPAQPDEKKSILVADDDMYIRLLVKKGLGSDYEVHEVSNGADVLSHYKIHSPHLLFLDIHLPGLVGTRVLQDVLAYDPEAHIIMLSSDSSLDNVQQCIKVGAKGFMAKPFTREKLVSYMEKCPAFNLDTESAEPAS